VDDHLVSFGRYSLDPHRRVLRHDGAEVGLGGRAMDILCVLAAHAGEPVSKHMLMDLVWPGQAVEENALQAQISGLRKVLGFPGQQHVLTVPGRGYRLLRADAAGASPAVAEPPAIVILPFANISGDPGQDYFADGMCDEITTALSRARSFFVIARNSAFTYKGRAVDVRQVGRELRVRYVVEGSTRVASGRVRITVQLIDASNGHHLWADRFDGDLADVFALQDRVTESVAGAIEPALRDAEIARAVTRPTDSMDAYDLYLRAQAEYYTLSRVGSDAAAELLRRAIRLDANYTVAKAALAWLHVYRETQGWCGPEDRAIAIALAREAFPADRGDPRTLSNVGHVLSYFAEDDEQAQTAVDRALRLNPNSAHVSHRAGWVYYHSAQPDAAIDCFERAMRLSPLDPEAGFFLGGCAGAHLMAGRTDECLALALRAIREMPGWVINHRFAMWALVRLGRLDEAKEIVQRVQSMTGGDRQALLRISRFGNNRAFNEEYSAVLRAVGVTE